MNTCLPHTLNMSTNTAKPSKLAAPRNRASRSIENSPSSKHDSINLDNVDVINTTTTPTKLTPSKLPAPLVCPCNVSQSRSNAVKVSCTKCKRQWHATCCNLSGIISNMAKELEAQGWQCPWCFKPAYQDPNQTAGTTNSPNLTGSCNTSKQIDEFLATMARIETCKEELNEGISSVEFFNEHIRHLLLDDSKFKNHTAKVTKLSEDMAEVKSQVSQINQLCASTSEIQHQLTELLSRPTSTVALPSDLAESFGKISDIPTDKIHKIETSVNELTFNVCTFRALPRVKKMIEVKIIFCTFCM